MRDEIMEVKREIEEVEEKSFALELLQDQRKANRRMFIIIMTLIVLLFAETVFMFYTLNDIGTYEDTITQENDGGYNNYIGNDGDINNGKTND
jgi:uncharacterized membrane protein